jgi:hypothetical protein
MGYEPVEPQSDEDFERIQKNKKCKNCLIKNNSTICPLNVKEEENCIAGVNIVKDNDEYKRFIEKYKKICGYSAPYPLNYLAQVKEYEHLSILIGMLIEKGVL